MTVNAVVDLSHHNGNVDFAAAKADGIAAVFHKASQGLGYVDPAYASNRARAEAAGLLWGAYHFGTGDDPDAQADHFLAAAGDLAGTLLVLDFEPNTQGASMSLAQARTFVQHVQAKTGKWPGLYSGSLIKQELGAGSDAVLANCWFWLSEYGPAAKVPPCWKSWTFWQYTDGNIGPEPHSVAGIGACDRDQYNGTIDGLRAFWAANAA